MRKLLATFDDFKLPKIFDEKYSIVKYDDDVSAMDKCDDFLIPIDQELNTLVNMKIFSPTAFGSLRLAFNLEKSQKIPSDFVGTLLSSPSAGRFQRLHFYVHPKAKFKDSLIEKLAEAIEKESGLIKRRPWCENLLPFIELSHENFTTDIVHFNSEMIFIIDRFPKGSWHYLCIPRKRIDTWWHLTLEDIPLLLRMQKEAEEFAKRLDPSAETRFGFHVIPSMKQLHLHVVNADFNSPILTHPQWNAFNTDFLISVPSVISELTQKGSISMSKERWDANWALLSVPLRCSICGRGFRKVATLQRHYLKEYTEIQKYNKKKSALF